jgi:hypothetical protein
LLPGVIFDPVSEPSSAPSDRQLSIVARSVVDDSSRWVESAEEVVINWL